VSVWTFHVLPLLLIADDSSTSKAEGLAVWKVRHQQLLWSSCEIMDPHARNHKCHRKASLSLAVLRGLPALSSRVSSSALQSILTCLFMPTSLLFSLNRRKQPDSGTVFRPSSLLAWVWVPFVIHGWAAVAELLRI